MVSIDSGSEIIQFPKGGYLISAKLTEESDYVLNNGVSFLEDTVDTTIDRVEMYAPTIGIVNGLQNSSTSGKLILMTDSACIDSVSATTSKCFWLLEKFIQIATSSSSYEDSSL